MFAAKHSSAKTRRRTAMWLFAAWLVFGVSQAFAACCARASGSIHSSTQVVAVPQHQGEADDCCDAAEPPCDMVLDAAPPPASTADLFVPGRIPLPGGRPVQLALRLPAAALADGPVRMPIARAPPDPIYLRLRRILI